MDYAEVYRTILSETALLVFYKKNGEIRVMLGTRNLHTIALKYGYQGQSMNSYDSWCNINNGNVAIFDLMLGEMRSFNIHRLVSINYLGEIREADKLRVVEEKYNNFKVKYEDYVKKELTMEDLD